MECYRYLRNVQDLLADGKTPYERRFGEPFEWPIIPFGAIVEYYPISARDQSRLYQFGKKVSHMEYSWDMHQSRGEFGKETFWPQTLIDELEDMDAAEIHPRRINAKEVFNARKESIFHIL